MVSNALCYTLATFAANSLVYICNPSYGLSNSSISYDNIKSQIDESCSFTLMQSLQIGTNISSLVEFNLHIPPSNSNQYLFINIPWVDEKYMDNSSNFLTVVPPSTFECVHEYEKSEEYNIIVESDKITGITQFIASNSNETSISGDWKIYVSQNLTNALIISILDESISKKEIIDTIISTASKNMRNIIKEYLSKISEPYIQQLFYTSNDICKCTGCIITSGIAVPQPPTFYLAHNKIRSSGGTRFVGFDELLNINLDKIFYTWMNLNSYHIRMEKRSMWQTVYDCVFTKYCNFDYEIEHDEL